MIASCLAPHLPGTVAGFHISQNMCFPARPCPPRPDFILILLYNRTDIPGEKDVFLKCRRNIFIPFLRQASQQLFSKENKFPFKKEIYVLGNKEASRTVVGERRFSGKEKFYSHRDG